MVDPERLTVKAQEAVGQAQSLAASLDHQEVDVEHLLLALVTQRDGLVIPLLQRLGARPEALEEAIRSDLASRPRVSGSQRQFISPALDGVLDEAQTIAQNFKDEFVSTEHLLLAIIAGGGRAAQLLAEHGVTGSLGRCPTHSAAKHSDRAAQSRPVQAARRITNGIQAWKLSGPAGPHRRPANEKGGQPLGRPP